MKYLNLLATSWRMAFLTAETYRANFLLMALEGIINTAITLTCVALVYGSVEEIAGWSRPEMIVLVCTAQIINIVYYSAIRPNILRFSASIRTGSFDAILLRPVSVLFSVLTGRVNLSSLSSVVVPAYFLGVQLRVLNQGALQPLAILGFVGLLLMGTALISFLMLLLAALSVVFINVGQIEPVYYSFMSAAEKPAEVFGRRLLLPLSFLVPVIPVANPAARLILSKGDWEFYIICVTSACVFIVICLICVKRLFRHYESVGN